MELKCHARVEYVHTTHNRSRFLLSELQIARDNWGNVVLNIETKSKKKTFKLTNNMTKVFNQFIWDGKATLQLGLPSVLIFIQQADPQQLRACTKTVEQIHTNPEFNLPGDEEAEEAEEAEEDSGFPHQSRIILGDTMSNLSRSVLEMSDDEDELDDDWTTANAEEEELWSTWYVTVLCISWTLDHLMENDCSVRKVAQDFGHY